jgi:hypothetical protein
LQEKVEDAGMFLIFGERLRKAQIFWLITGFSPYENHDPRVKWASKCDPTDNGPTL